MVKLVQDFASLEWLNTSINHYDYVEFVKTLNSNTKFIKLIKKGFAVKNIKILYGLDLSNNDGFEVKPVYALITLYKEKHSLMFCFVDIVKKKITKIIEIKNRNNNK